MDSGLLEIVSPSPNFYPHLKTIKGSLGDSDERTRWRTKQNLDYVYMMLYSQHRGTYYVQLEDDILSKKGFVRSMKSFALQKTMEKEDWLMLDFCQLGFIGLLHLKCLQINILLHFLFSMLPGKLFRSSDLWRLAEFFLLFYKDKPGDWLLSHFFNVKYCKLDQNHVSSFSEAVRHN
jgi:alpha-1,3-mannosylglycoprotein beta-1,4-N-acetylglucosaminyltransferase A/B